jgi:uracil phosphoribosyltransferase
MGMLNAALSFYKSASVGYVGVKRNEETLQPMPYYENLPKITEKSVVFVLDPMLATGGSVNYTLDVLKKFKVKKIVVLSVVGVKEGITLIKKNHPNVVIYLAALDEKLNEVGYIIPGLGDCGDRLNKT